MLRSTKWCAAVPGSIRCAVGPGSAVHRQATLHRVRDTKLVRRKGHHRLDAV